jgi:hypothetical protein
MGKIGIFVLSLGIITLSQTAFSEEIVCKKTIEKYSSTLKFSESKGEIKIIDNGTTIKFKTTKFKTKDYSPKTLNFIKECLREAIDKAKSCENPKFSNLDVKEKKTFLTSKFYVQTEIQCSDGMEMAKN